MRLYDRLPLERDDESRIQKWRMEYPSLERILLGLMKAEEVMYIRSDGLLAEVANLGMRRCRQSWLSKA